MENWLNGAYPNLRAEDRFAGEAAICARIEAMDYLALCSDLDLTPEDENAKA